MATEPLATVYSIHEARKVLTQEFKRLGVSLAIVTNETYWHIIYKADEKGWTAEGYDTCQQIIKVK